MGMTRSNTGNLTWEEQGQVYRIEGSTMCMQEGLAEPVKLDTGTREARVSIEGGREAFNLKRHQGSTGRRGPILPPARLCQDGDS